MPQDLIEIILPCPRETTALLRRLCHAPANKIAAAKARLVPAFFIPVLIDSGGNSGTQATAFVMRGLDTGDPG